MLPPEPSDASVFTQPAPDSPRARRYMALFDRSVAEVRERFDAERGLIRHTVPEGSPGVAPEIASLDRFLRKSYISPLNQWAYRVGRTSSSHTGTLAYAYAQPLSRYYHDPGLLRAVCQGFEAFIRAQDASGEFVFTPIRYASVYGTHEMSWRLECFITAYFCIRDALTEDQRTLIQSDIEEIAAEFKAAVLARGRQIPEQAMEGQSVALMVSGQTGKPVAMLGAVRQAGGM